jgi:asparagine synthase (glutamine-hydrolysing)
MYSTVRQGELSALLGAETSDTGLSPALAYWRDRTGDMPEMLLDEAMRLDARTVLPDNLLLYGDKLSMAVSLEARVPFLDLPLMATAERVPANVKMAGGVPKALWKEVLSPWLPPGVARRRKIGFQTPVDEWFRSDRGLDLRKRLLDHDSGCRAHLDGREVERIITEHERGAVDHKRLLFALLVFELWHGEYVRQKHIAGGAS